jgi:hypothetical protein
MGNTIQYEVFNCTCEGLIHEKYHVDAIDYCLITTVVYYSKTGYTKTCINYHKRFLY